MKKTSRLTVASLVGLPVIGLAVGAVAHRTATGVAVEASPRASLSFMPDGASLVGHVDLASLRQSPLGSDWQREMESRGELRGLEELRDRLGLDPMTDFETLTFAMAANGSAGADQPKKWGLAFGGRFDSRSILSRLDQRGEVTAEEHFGETVYRLSPSGDSQLALAFPADGTILLAEPDYLREMLAARAARAEGDVPPMVRAWDDGTFSAATLWLTGSQMGGFGSFGPVGDQPGPTVPPIQTFSITAKLDADVALRARGRAADSESATKLADVVRGFVALASFKREAEPDLASIIDALSIQQAGNDVEISLSVPYEVIKRLSEKNRTPSAAHH